MHWTPLAGTNEGKVMEGASSTRGTNASTGLVEMDAVRPLGEE